MDLLLLLTLPVYFYVAYQDYKRCFIDTNLLLLLEVLLAILNLQRVFIGDTTVASFIILSLVLYEIVNRKKVAPQISSDFIVFTLTGSLVASLGLEHLFIAFIIYVIASDVLARIEKTKVVPQMPLNFLLFLYYFVATAL